MLDRRLTDMSIVEIDKAWDAGMIDGPTVAALTNDDLHRLAQRGALDRIIGETWQLSRRDLAEMSGEEMVNAVKRGAFDRLADELRDIGLLRAATS